MLKIKYLEEKLVSNIDSKRLSRFKVAYRSLDYQDSYCRYHYEQYQNELNCFRKSMSNELPKENIQNPQFYRIAFEAHSYAFFRALHSIVESAPYLLNILLDINPDAENRKINWNTIKGGLTRANQSTSLINDLKNSESYKELEHLVNISKHRRIPRVDSGEMSLSKKPKFHHADLDEEFRVYEIEDLMETLYDELYFKILNIIQNVADGM